MGAIKCVGIPDQSATILASWFCEKDSKCKFVREGNEIESSVRCRVLLCVTFAVRYQCLKSRICCPPFLGGLLILELLQCKIPRSHMGLGLIPQREVGTF